MLRNKDAQIKDFESQLDNLHQQLLTSSNENKDLKETIKEHDEKFM